MTTQDLLESPELRPFLPLLYVAWADGDLSKQERQLVCDHLTAQPWLKPRLREALLTWLDPKNPPDAESLAALHETVARVATTLSPEARQSMARFAEEMSALQPTAPKESAPAVTGLLETLAVEDAELALPTDFPPDTTFQQPPRFDVERMQQLLDGPFAPARRAVREFLGKPEHRAAYGMPPSQHRALVQGWLGELAKQGAGKLAFPGVTTEEKSLGPFFATVETLAFGDLSLLVKFGVQFGLWGGSIYFLGTDEQKKRWLPQVATNEAPGCFAMSEVGHGSNVADLETVARYDPATREFIVHTPSESARKDWAGNAAVYARTATVFAQLEVEGKRHGVHALVVPIRDAAGAPLPGIRIGDCGHKMGLNGVDNGRLWFDNVRVPADALLGRYARITEDHRYESSIESPSRRFFTMLGTLVGGRLVIASAAVSAAKVGLTAAIRYAAARRQFGPEKAPETLLLHYPTHQRRLLPQLAATYAYSFAAEALRAEFLATARDADTRVLEADAAGIKAAASWHATKTLQLCREACGGQGYLSVNRIPDLKADADIFTTFEGDNTVLLQLLAKSLLTNFRQQFAKGGPKALLKHLAGKARTAILEKNPIVTRGTDAGTLRSADYQVAALRFREEALLESAARRLQKRGAKKVDAAQALNDVQEHLVALALAHVDRKVMEAFVKAEAGAPEGLKGVLGRLRALHGLCTLEAQLGWYLQDGYMEAGRARAVRKEVVALFGELVQDAVPLVNAFGIPDACLAAPIAFSDPAHPRWSEEPVV